LESVNAAFLTEGRQTLNGEADDGGREPSDPGGKKHEVANASLIEAAVSELPLMALLGFCN